MTDLALKLQAIRDQLRHWSNWNTEMRRREGLPTENDTHVIAVPPHWPTHGMLRQWADTIEEARTLADATPKSPDPDLSSLRKGAEVWQPIETAPTDYTHVIGMDAEGIVSRTWFFAPSSITRNWLKVPGGGKWKPVQWMPLSAALVSGSREDGDG